MVAPSGVIKPACLAKKNGGRRSALPTARMCAREVRATHQMRRTGNAPDPPTTGIEACGKAGMTNDVALMKGVSAGYGLKSKLALPGCADRRQCEGAGVTML